MDNEAAAVFANFMPILVMVLIFYFLLYRPQKRAQEERTRMLDGLKVGNRVITMGGIFGTIVVIKDEVITVNIADKVDVEVSRNAINGVVDVKNAED